MPIFVLIGLGVLSFGFPLVITARRRHPRFSITVAREVESDPAEIPTPETSERTSLDRLPDHLTLAGVPLRELLSDRSGPGALLRERLLSH